MRILSREKYTGTPPKWPLPTGSSRERSLWRKTWEFPQAAVWAEEPWRWLTIAHYVRWAVKSEAVDASPSTMTQVIRLSADIGLSPAGLRENGWTIEAVPEMEEAEPTPTSTVAPVRRLRTPNAG